MSRSVRFPRVALLSKYPPYVSGHASQAFWLNRALIDVHGSVQHQFSYSGSTPSAFQRPGIRVHQVGRGVANPKVPDGHLTKAVASAVARLVPRHGIDAVLGLYSDPHARMLSAARSALALSGRGLHVAISVEGSDLTDSIGRHLDDGEAAVLLAEIASADTVFAVSDLARDLLISSMQQVAGSRPAELLAKRVVRRHPGLPPEFFEPPGGGAIAAWRSRRGIPPAMRLVGSQLRLVPEKRPELLLELADLAHHRGRDDLGFVLTGRGPLLADLQRRAEGRANVWVSEQHDPQDALLMRQACDVGVFASVAVPGWTETFGIAPLEYQAAGTPVVVSGLPAFEESTHPAMPRVPGEAPATQWLTAIDAVLASDGLSRQAARFAAGFTSERSAGVVLDTIAAALDRDRHPRERRFLA